MSEQGMVEVFDIYEKMERNNILLSFKGEVTSDLLTHPFSR